MTCKIVVCFKKNFICFVLGARTILMHNKVLQQPDRVVFFLLEHHEKSIALSWAGEDRCRIITYHCNYACAMIERGQKLVSDAAKRGTRPNGDVPMYLRFEGGYNGGILSSSVSISASSLRRQIISHHSNVMSRTFTTRVEENASKESS